MHAGQLPCQHIVAVLLRMPRTLTPIIYIHAAGCAALLFAVLHGCAGYSLSQVLPCLLRVARVHTAACNTQLPCAISCKYLDDKLEQVAALPPVEQHKVVQLEQQQQQLYQCQVKDAAAACSNSC